MRKKKVLTIIFKFLSNLDKSYQKSIIGGPPSDRFSSKNKKQGFFTISRDDNIDNIGVIVY